MQDISQDAASRPTGWSRWLAIFARIALVGFLVVEFRAARSGPDEAVFQWPDLSLTTVHDLEMLRAWAHDVLNTAGHIAGYFAVLGALVAMSFVRPRAFLMRQARTLKVLITASALALVLLVLAERGLPTLQQSAPALIGLLLGVWVGGALQGGLAGVLHWFLQVAFLAAILVFGTAYLSPQLTSAEPMPGLELTVSSQDKARLADVIRGQLAEVTVPDGDGKREVMVQLQFTESEINQLLAWFLATQFDHCHARVTLAEGAVSCALSARLEAQRPGQTPRYVNVVFSGPVTIQDGQLDAAIESCRVGNVSVSPKWLQNLMPPLVNELERQPEFRRVLASIEDLDITPERAAVIGRRAELRESVMPLLRGEFDTVELEKEALLAQVKHLSEVGPKYPAGEERFLGMLQEAFRLAEQRSTSNGGHAVVENRAALWAITYLIGFRRLEMVTGEILPGRERRRAVASIVPLEIRGRTDWVKHFLISGVVTTLSNGFMSNIIGQWKERLDAQAGGSGFSFSDLLADYAGRRFAVSATRNEASARQLQRAVSNGVRIDELFPVADDLPESIPAAVWESRYGAGSGPEYERLKQIIEQRLNRCRLLNL